MTKFYPLTDASKLPDLGYVQFASIGRPHGLKGAFFLKTDDRRTTWDGYKTILIQLQDGFFEKKVTNSYLSGNALALLVEDINSRTEVEAVYNNKIYVHKSEIKFEEGEYLVQELKNFEIICKIEKKLDDNIPKHDCENYKVIGRVVGVISYGAQENLEIQLQNSQDTVLYPFIDKYILKIDSENKRIEVEYIEEFLNEQ